MQILLLYDCIVDTNLVNVNFLFLLHSSTVSALREAQLNIQSHEARSSLDSVGGVKQRLGLTKRSPPVRHANLWTSGRDFRTNEGSGELSMMSISPSIDVIHNRDYMTVSPATESLIPRTLSVSNDSLPEDVVTSRTSVSVPFEKESKLPFHERVTHASTKQREHITTNRATSMVTSGNLYRYAQEGIVIFVSIRLTDANGIEINATNDFYILLRFQIANVSISYVNFQRYLATALINNVHCM